MTASRTVEAFTEFVEKESWENGVALPPSISKSKEDEDSNNRADTAMPHIPDIPAMDPEKLLKDVLYVATNHHWATGVLVVIGSLVGLLLALLVCFPSPRIVMLQPQDAPVPTGPKLKAE